jgi:hypothetical protein
MVPGRYIGEKREEYRKYKKGLKKKKERVK